MSDITLGWYRSNSGDGGSSGMLVVYEEACISNGSI